MGALPDGLAGCSVPTVVPVIVMIVTALTAAVFYGAGTAMEQRQAAAAPQSSAGRLRVLFLLAGPPVWVCRNALAAGGPPAPAGPAAAPAPAAARGPVCAPAR